MATKAAAILLSALFLIPIISLGQETGLVPCEGPDCNFASIVELADRIMDFLLFYIAMPAATLLFLYAGFLYASAGAKPSNVKKATEIFQNVFWGFILALSAWLIVNLITTSLLKPGVLDQ